MPEIPEKCKRLREFERSKINTFNNNFTVDEFQRYTYISNN